jgi:hypothetical protein
VEQHDALTTFGGGKGREEDYDDATQHDTRLNASAQPQIHARERSSANKDAVIDSFLPEIDFFDGSSHGAMWCPAAPLAERVRATIAELQEGI